MSTECWAPPNWIRSETSFKSIKTHVFPYMGKSSPIFCITNFCIYICRFERGSKKSFTGKSVLGWWWPAYLIDLDPFIVIFPINLQMLVSKLETISLSNSKQSWTLIAKVSCKSIIHPWWITGLWSTWISRAATNQNNRTPVQPLWPMVPQFLLLEKFKTRWSRERLKSSVFEYQYFPSLNYRIIKKPQDKRILTRPSTVLLLLLEKDHTKTF